MHPSQPPAAALAAATMVQVGGMVEVVRLDGGKEVGKGDDDFY